MTFEEVWETTSKIGGFFERDEAELYWNILNTLPVGARVVEVGLENGKSTSIPAQMKKFVLHCVDDFSTFGDEGRRRFEETMKNLQMNDYALWSVPSAGMDGVLAELDLVLIDADHADCETDCRVWIPMLKHGGWMLFHDYGRDSWNIKAVVDNHCAGWFGRTVGSLAARRKPHE